MDASVWERKDELKQKAHFEKFVKTTIMKENNTVASTDGQLSCCFAVNGGKKLNQRKRKINARTTTVSKRPKN